MDYQGLPSAIRAATFKQLSSLQNEDIQTDMESFADWLSIVEEQISLLSRPLEMAPQEEAKAFDKRRKANDKLVKEAEKVSKEILKLREKFDKELTKRVDQQIREIERKNKLKVQEQENELKRLDKERKRQQKEIEFERRQEELQDREEAKRQKELDKQFGELDKDIAKMNAATAHLHRKMDEWCEPNGSKLTIVESVDARRVGWVAMNWDKLVAEDKIGKAYDNVSRTYLPDDVYKRQFMTMCKQLNLQAWPYATREVQYTQASYGYGRMMARAKLPGQGISRPIRHTIFKGMGQDIDFKNAHPVFFHRLCEKIEDLECEHLTKYIENREPQIKEGITFAAKHGFDISRDDLKRAYLSKLNGGSGSIMKNGLEVPKTAAHKAFDEEIKSLHQYAYNLLKVEHPEYEESALSSRGEDHWNLQGSVVNHWLCDQENRVLHTCYVHIREKLKKRINFLAFDGLFLRDKLTEEEMQELEELIYEQHDFTVEIVAKEMDEGFDIPSEELQLITKQTPCYRYFDWKYFDENRVGGSEIELANLLLPILRESYIITSRSENEGLIWDEDMLLYDNFTSRDLIPDIQRILNDSAKTAVDFYLTQFQNKTKELKKIIKDAASKEEQETMKQEVQAIQTLLNKWLKRVDDNTAWGNYSKCEKVCKTLAPSLFQRNNAICESINVAQPYHMPLKNGQCIELTTGKTWKRTPEDAYTFECPVKYTPWDSLAQSKKDIVLNYINTMFTDNTEKPRLAKEDQQEYIDYIQVLFGYALTLSTETRQFYLITGGDEGSNGKSKWFNALEKILGMNQRFSMMQR
ncbi:MAG: hypothetical protein ACOYNN_13475, partial [Terrimicrobiaceae bacterium]